MATDGGDDALSVDQVVLFDWLYAEDNRAK